MITENQRLEPRHKTSKLRVELRFGEQTSEAVMVDASRTAACLNKITPDGWARRSKGTLLIHPYSHEIIERKCQIQRVGEGPIPTCVVRFVDGLSSSQLNAILQLDAGKPTDTHEIAKQDQEAVRSEVLSIQGCRSQIFIATMAALGAAAMGTGVAMSNAAQEQWPMWVIFGAGIAAFLLLVGILATIEKARAINIRKGFLAALADYLRKGQAPPSYCGWGHLQYLQNTCGARRDAGECTQVRRYKETLQKYEEARAKQQKRGRPTDDTASPPCLSETCWTLGDFEVASTNERRRLIPGMFDSFMSFTGTIYCVSYVLVATTMLVALTIHFANRQLVEPVIALACITLGGSLGAISAFYSPFFFHKRKPRDGQDIDRTEPARKLVRGIFQSCGVVAVVLVVISVSVYDVSWFTSALGCGAVSLMSALLSGLAVFLVYQLSKVRKGLYSTPSMYASWRHALLECQHDRPLSDRVSLDREFKQEKKRSKLF